MATIETTWKETGTRSLRKPFLNIRETAKGIWYETPFRVSISNSSAYH